MTAKAGNDIYKYLVDLYVPKWIVSYQKRTNMNCVSFFPHTLTGLEKILLVRKRKCSYFSMLTGIFRFVRCV